MLLYSLVRAMRFHEAEKLLMEAGLQPNDAYDRVDEIASRLGYDEPADRW
jgi:AraC-like DNA-binding protein